MSALSKMAKALYMERLEWLEQALADTTPFFHILYGSQLYRFGEEIYAGSSATTAVRVGTLEDSSQSIVAVSLLPEYAIGLAPGEPVLWFVRK